MQKLQELLELKPSKTRESFKIAAGQRSAGKSVQAKCIGIPFGISFHTNVMEMPRKKRMEKIREHIREHNDFPKDADSFIVGNAITSIGIPHWLHIVPIHACSKRKISR